MKFSDLNLHPILRANLEKINFEQATPIQSQAIPIVRAGKDVAGLAQTGTGKTAAFLIPIIDRILRGRDADTSDYENKTVAFTEWKKRQFVLILVPTRELAEQVQETAEKFLQDTDMSSVSVYGGTSYDKQTQALKNGVEFVIATPGRLIDLYKEHICDLGQVRAMVFDEADRMFDMGFKDDMKFILRRVPRERQFLVFSATLNFDVLNVAYEFGADPVEINISRDQAKAEHVKDHIFHVGQEEKPAYLLSVLRKYNPKQAIIFSNFKHNVERIARFLSKNNIPAVGISSLLTQAQRTKVMTQFKEQNDRNILVATDLAARGLDILGVDLVINYDLPDDPENYVHRIGRTGRAGAEGSAYSLVSDRDVEALTRVEAYLKHKVETGWLEDAEIIKEFAPFPSSDEGGRGDRGGRDRGPRGPRHGGDRDRGSRGPRQGGDRDRGPRRPRYDGPREQQPREMREGQRHEGHRDRHTGRHRGERGGEQRGERDQQRGDQRGGRDQQRNFNRDGQRHGGGQRHGNQQRRDQGNGHPRRDQQSRRDGRHTQGRGASAPYRGPAKSSQASLGQKVSGFFKKLFGSDKAKPDKSKSGKSQSEKSKS